MPTTAPTESTQILERVETLARALRAKDIDTLMTHYAPNVITYDLTSLLEVRGADAYRKNFEMWFGSVRGAIDYEIRDLRITTREDVAFCHSLSHVKSTRTNEQKVDYWVRVTSGFQKMNGKWMITHEHVSAPIDMETERALLDLHP